MEPRPAIETYPVPPGAAPSASYRVRVLGVPVFVERYADVSYARFSMRGSVNVEIQVRRPIGKHAVFPEERVTSPSVVHRLLNFRLRAPDQVIVWVDQLEKLFLLPDPMEENVPVPGRPGVINVIEYGADPTARSSATIAIQTAIDRAANLEGGGTVVIPQGVYRSGTLSLKSNVTLYISPGALLRGSRDPGDYPVDPGRRETAADESLPPDVRYLGRTMTFSRLLLIDRADNVRILGRGTIDGEGSFLRNQCGLASNLLRVRESTNVVIGDVLFRNAAAWSIHLLASTNVALRNVKVINDRTNLNTDGIDPDMSSDVTIDRSFVYTKDDAVCVKATGNSDLHGNPERIVVTNSLVSSLDAGLKVGTESEASTFSDILFENNYVFDCGRAMSIVVRDGATYDRITYRHIHVGPHVEHLIEQVIGVRDPHAALGAIHALTFDGVIAPSFVKPTSNWTWYTQFRPSPPAGGAAVNVFEGADERHAVDGLTIRGLLVNGQHLRSASTAEEVANLSIGPHVRRVVLA